MSNYAGDSIEDIAEMAEAFEKQQNSKTITDIIDNLVDTDDYNNTHYISKINRSLEEYGSYTIARTHLDSELKKQTMQGLISSSKALVTLIEKNSKCLTCYHSDIVKTKTKCNEEYFEKRIGFCDVRNNAIISEDVLKCTKYKKVDVYLGYAQYV